VPEEGENGEDYHRFFVETAYSGYVNHVLRYIYYNIYYNTSCPDKQKGLGKSPNPLFLLERETGFESGESNEQFLRVGTKS